ncbi:MAG: hypothetical protein Unbinned838contig1000_12 [Prokaryotic dsDNA virus sp.]|nr:MAG: hypothetical protein Unbinned838contig1000_12 [Prokaryotic dsDNA virus sp.]|tara:strand:+ start:3096 stop:3521 length:426 start_codon:yes stop_codon:yes gene_type:complete
MSKVKTLKAETTTNTDLTKLKNKDLLTISQGLAYINSKESKVWHTITKNLDSIAKDVETVNAAHKKLTEDLATKDEHGNPVRTENNQIDFGDNIDKATESWTATLETEVEVTLYPIQLSDLSDLNLDANIMKPLLGLIVVE